MRAEIRFTPPLLARRLMAGFVTPKIVSLMAFLACLLAPTFPNPFPPDFPFPFAKTILNQYSKRKILFKNEEILPEFHSLVVIKAVQSLGNSDDRFLDWFEALEFMKNEINKQDYDICLIGAGAYGFPLAAHVKRMGKKSVHMGGALQLLFGIKGKRWEDPNYGVREWGIEPKAYTTLINNHWVRPDETEKPETANQVEGACYW